MLESIAYSKSQQCFINFCFIHKCHINKICLSVYITYYVFLVMLVKSITYYASQSKSLKVHTLLCLSFSTFFFSLLLSQPPPSTSNIAVPKVDR